ncbi:hypothetical protein UFOVP787_83 [uncultured Caudovirales phage]|uniref:Uncharacterized protein n=1 Tax=uncultured Caudovirales phage TaxID=2100421 RepID=A0A6J5NS97_9CAUD|nr:hypothetical protein UFOVP787_83 [uncultured Caudovirales phage]
MTKVTKTSAVIGVMLANEGKIMTDVLPLIDQALQEQLGIPYKEGYAREWYVWVVQKKLAPGVVIRKNSAPKVTKVATPKVAKVAKVAKVKAEKPLKAEKALKAEKSPEEIARVRAANLARMQSITAKYGSRVAKSEGDGVEGFDSTSARAEVDNILTDDSFAAPQFLSRDQVRALV